MKKSEWLGKLNEEVEKTIYNGKGKEDTEIASAARINQLAGYGGHLTTLTAMKLVEEAWEEYEQSLCLKCR